MVIFRKYNLLWKGEQEETLADLLTCFWWFRRGDDGASRNGEKWIPVGDMPEDGKKPVIGKVCIVKEMGCEV